MTRSAENFQSLPQCEIIISPVWRGGNGYWRSLETLALGFKHLTGVKALLKSCNHDQVTVCKERTGINMLSTLGPSNSVSALDRPSQLDIRVQGSPLMEPQNRKKVERWPVEDGEG